MQNIENTQSTAYAIFESSPHASILVDHNFKVIDCNLAALKLTGFNTKADLLAGFEERMRGGIPEFQSSGRRSLPFDEWASIAAREGFVKFETEFIPDGKLLNLSVEFRKIPYEDSFAIVVFIYDITEIKKIQESLRKACDTAEAANESKSVFLANMSHEIRTPMNSIIGFSELAQDYILPQKARKYLSYISDTSKWLLYIINDLLDNTKIESGKIVLESIPFDIQDVVIQCQSVLMPKTEDRGFSLQFHCEPIDGKRCLGDPVRLRQVLMNLLSNAIKFTDSGTVKLITSIISSDDSSAIIRFEVRDSGIGISPEQISSIFDPYKQADDTFTRRFGGTGLGLPISKSLVEMMGGVLTVESEPGVGSIFSFDLSFDLVDSSELPLSDKDAGETISFAGSPGFSGGQFNVEGVESSRGFADGQSGNESIAGITGAAMEKPIFSGEVLVCEDNYLNQQVIYDHLERVGLKTVIAQNGKESVEIVTERINNNEKPFDLIFMDIHMPVMDGLEAASIITGMGLNTPIVAMTANIMNSYLELYKSSGMLDFLGKPYTSQDLWKCLMRYLPVSGYSTVDKQQQSEEDDKSLKQLRVYFAQNNKSTFSKFMQALEDDDIMLAHRTVHTLKSNAGQIGEEKLQKAAAEMEAKLLEGENRSNSEQAGILESELNSVLEKFSPLLVKTESDNDTVRFDAEKAQDIFGKLEPLLINNNTSCMNMLDDILRIPGAEELARLVEGFEFKRAVIELSILKERMG